ncbi:unnamed protein product [Penicillium egyptiacum]|uniref:Zn(2)-C6 fungal-type domain-containing protein n=1 Tax=Penicillium egyptiacum TaxID=1303716 RepID=A0A9W4KCR9_9EURO|nr:unnamed protein product [Penicillium egyptiacum]
MVHPPSTTVRSCLECRRRKIKCDRILPCSYCVKVKIQCSYPPPRAEHAITEGNKASDDMAVRIERIERTLESFEQSLSQLQGLVHTQFSSPSVGGSHGHDQVQQPHESRSYDERVLNQSPPLFKALPTSALEYLRPPRVLVSFLWQKYLENVEPILKILHTPTFQRQILSNTEYREALGAPTECLIFAVCYAAVATMTVEDCRVELDEDRHEVLKRYRIGVESSLAKADLLKSSDMDVLQAFVIYIVCSRGYDKGPDIRKLIGTAIGIALKIGLHRDASTSGLPPFQVEMRRRLWWQTYILDITIAEDTGTDPRILESWFDTRLPSNVSDASLDPDMKDPPRNCSGKTEMVLSLARSEISNFAHRTIFSDQSSEEDCHPVLSTPQKCTAIDLFKEKVEQQYLSHLDQSIALDYFTTVSSNLMLAKLKLAVIKLQARQDQSMLTHVNFRKVCTEILQKTSSLRHYEKGRQWLWSLQNHAEWDALTCLLINLSLAPKGEALDLAWQAVNETYNYLKKDGDARGDCRWVNIEELHTKALFSRDMIQINPSQWAASPDDDSGFEESHTMVSESPQQLGLGALKRQREDDTGSSRSSPGELEPIALNCRSEVPAMQSEAQEQLPGMWALGNAAAAAPTAIDGSSHLELAGEPTDIPSSGTGCQWSATLFERYFQVLGSEQTPQV